MTSRRSIGQMYEDKSIRDSFNRVIGPVGPEYVTDIEFRENGDLIGSVDVKDAEAIRTVPQEPPDTQEPEEKESTTFVRITRVAFRDPLSVACEEGEGRTFTAEVLDEDFVRQVHARKLGFFEGDAYEVRLRTRFTFKAGNKILPHYKIVKVVRRLPPPEQLPLLGA